MQLRSLFFRLTLALALAGAALASMVMTASYLYLAPQLPPAAELRQVELQIPLRIYSRDGLLLGEYGEQRRTPIRFGQLPETFILAVLSAEDERFFQHGGVDIRGLLRAATELARYREIRSGGSTITMQVARNFFLDRGQTFLRKFNEIVLALQIERVLSKEEILELYLNKIFLGYRAYGAEAAAQVYYGTSIDQLNLAQWAMIAGLPKAPSAYNPLASPERALVRRNWILGRMLSNGHISSDAYNEALGQPVSARLHTTRPEVEASYVADMVRQEALDRFGLRAYTDGIRVYTTLDSRLQQAAVSSLRQGLHDYDERHGWRGIEAHVSTDNLPELAIQPDQRSDKDRQAWAKSLEGLNPIANLQPVIVALTDDTGALLITADANEIILPFDAMSWAAPYIDESTVGQRPQKPTDLVQPGDIIRLRPIIDDEDTQWRLAQIPAAQASVVAVDPRDGAIKAMQGGYSFSLSQFNRASEAQRQTGSALKPFIYMAGLRQGMTTATIINDAPIVFEDSQLEAAWRPTGAGSRFYGPTRIREALYRSLNLVSIRLLQQTGIDNTINTLSDFGFPTGRFSRDLSLALGSAALTPLEVATAYAVFANGGHVVTPYIIERIDDNNDKTLWKAPVTVLCNEACQQARATTDEISTESLIDGREIRWLEPRHDPRDIWLMDSMLKDVIQRGTGAKARSLGREDIAGKTGSTNDYRDAWFAGYSPALSTVSWVGFDDSSSLGRGEYGGKAALPVWIDFMTVALQGLPEIIPPQPPGIVSLRIHPDSGKRARPGSRNTLFEYFRADNLPAEAPDDQQHIPPTGEADDVSPQDLF